MANKNDEASNWLKGEKDVATYFNVELLALVLFWNDVAANANGDPNTMRILEGIMRSINVTTVDKWLQAIVRARFKKGDNDAVLQSKLEKVKQGVGNMVETLQGAVTGNDKALNNLAKSFGSLYHLINSSVHVSDQGKIEVSHSVTWSGNNTQDTIYFMFNDDISRNMLNTSLPEDEVMTLMRTGANSKIPYNFGSFKPCERNNVVSPGHINGSMAFFNTLRQVVSTIPGLEEMAQLPLKRSRGSGASSMYVPAGLFSKFCHAMLDIDESGTTTFPCSGAMRDKVTFTHWVPFVDNKEQSNTIQIRHGSNAGNTEQSGGDNGGAAEGNQLENNQRITDQALGADQTQDDLIRAAMNKVSLVAPYYAEIAQLIQLPTKLSPEPLAAMNGVSMLLRKLFDISLPENTAYYNIISRLPDNRTVSSLSLHQVTKDNPNTDAINIFSQNSNELVGIGRWVMSVVDSDRAHAIRILTCIKRLISFNDAMYNDFLNNAYNCARSVIKSSTTSSASGNKEKKNANTKQLIDLAHSIVSTFDQHVTITAQNSLNLAKGVALSLLSYTPSEAEKSEMQDILYYMLVDVAGHDVDPDDFDGIVNELADGDFSDVPNKTYRLCDLLSAYCTGEENGCDVAALAISYLLDKCVFNVDGSDAHSLGALADALAAIADTQYATNETAEVIAYAATCINNSKDIDGSIPNARGMLKELNNFKLAIESETNDDVADISEDADESDAKEPEKNPRKVIDLSAEADDIDMLDY